VKTPSQNQQSARLVVYPICLNPFNCDFYRLNHAVFVEVHPINAGFAVVAIGLGEGTAVVNDKPVVGAGRVNDRVMSRAGRYGWVLLQHFTHPLKRPTVGPPK